MQLIVSTILLLGVIYLAAFLTFPNRFSLGVHENQAPYVPYLCSIFGLVSGMIIAAYTEYVTSHAYGPVR